MRGRHCFQNHLTKEEGFLTDNATNADNTNSITTKLVTFIAGVYSMTTKPYTILVLLAMAMAMSSARAEQYKDFGDYTIHYSAFTTDILSPAVAKAYRITRSKNRAMINISVLKKVMGTTGAPSRAAVVATATNLNNQLRQVEFREVQEEGAIYYLAELPVNNGETLKISLNITPEGESEAYKFSFQEQFVTNY